MRRGLSLETVRLSRKIAESTRCTTCGLLTIVLSEVGAGIGSSSAPTTITAATHCACPGGPLAPVAPSSPGKTDADFAYGFNFPARMRRGRR